MLSLPEASLHDIFRSAPRCNHLLMKRKLQGLLDQDQPLLQPPGHIFASISGRIATLPWSQFRVCRPMTASLSPMFRPSSCRERFMPVVPSSAAATTKKLLHHRVAPFLRTLATRLSSEHEPGGLRAEIDDEHLIGLEHDASLP